MNFVKKAAKAAGETATAIGDKSKQLAEEHDLAGKLEATKKAAALKYDQASTAAVSTYETRTGHSYKVDKTLAGLGVSAGVTKAKESTIAAASSAKATADKLAEDYNVREKVDSAKISAGKVADDYKVREKVVSAKAAVAPTVASAAATARATSAAAKEGWQEGRSGVAAESAPDAASPPAVGPR